MQGNNFNLGSRATESRLQPAFVASNQSANPYSAAVNPTDSRAMHDASQGTQSTLFWDTQMAQNQNATMLPGSSNFLPL